MDINKRIIILLLLIICNSCFGPSTKEKEEWLKLPPESRFSEKNMRRVWGHALRGNSAEMYYGSNIYDLAVAIKKKKSNEKIKEHLSKLNKDDLNYRNDNMGMTILMFSIWFHNFEAFKLLIQAGADPNLYNYVSDNNAMLEASSFAFLDDRYMKYLINNGGDVNSFSDKPNDLTPLMAVLSGHKALEHAKLLIEAGADPNFVHYFSRDTSKVSPWSGLTDSFLHKQMDVAYFFTYRT
ncbi:ankyrin repeat domain-containing protein [Flammeovirga sp. SJP92]|uniref:ankyrin repeat domain-containing protein n=1 Tax=Flammeovirga sp. SJP92 TaxID=1775430 RepID=UPI0012F7D61D|nr:ankyrin repeat domain-containing protein [Flammeovirga sp. SJP92]